MLQIKIPSKEYYDEINEEFVSTKEQVLHLEHSLVSLSKWESKYCKPFLSKEEKTMEETIYYIKCMTITQNVDDSVYNALSINNMNEINSYIEAPMTATWYKEEKKGLNRRVITSELIYCWMISLGIPFECQKWHLNRLFTLISVCDLENRPKKKSSKKELLARNAALNAARRQKLNSRG